MKAEPLVSIIIASYNSKDTIKYCLDSLLNQTYKNIEIIVCDDNSIDGSFRILKEYEKAYPQIKVLHNEENLKVAATRNRCIDEARGTYIAIQDADDMSDLTRIEQQVAFLEEHPEISFASSQALLFSDNPNRINGVMDYGKAFPTKWSFLWGISFVHPATMFRALCLRAVGNYRVSSETKRGEDYDLFMRLYAAGYKGANIQQPLYIYKLDAQTVKRGTTSGSKDEYLVRMKGYKLLGLMPLGYIFALKPYLANFIHNKIGWFKYKY